MTLLIALLLMSHMGVLTAPNFVGVCVVWVLHLVYNAVAKG